jgi:hypothetical protein
MRNRSTLPARVLVGVVALAFTLQIAAADRTTPTPLPSHPGNIFLAGENVVVPAPPGEGDAWRVVNYEDKVVIKGQFKDGEAEVGPLPVGWYKLVRGGAGQLTNRAFLGVLEPLRAPTPLSSPICMDVAMAWFFPKEEPMRQVANLCQLAGINWVRDRLLWGELEPKRGEFVDRTRYDVSARVQMEAGLQVLQVAHVSAPWANANAKRFPPDLRDFYNFWREAARRWQGQVLAFEPWNEADITVFGGHTGSEMASLQKAAYLGLKAGNSNVIACLNVFAIRRAATLSDFHANEAWPYFDTYNLHHYEPLENYPALYADHRAVSAGKPLWVSECSVRVRWQGDEQLKELSGQNLRLQSEQATKTYALAIHEGAETVFYFVLPHYSERQLQYGVLRADLTPRPAYVAVAAAGRLLADAKPLGRVDTANTGIHGYVFDAKPDGERGDVLVIWSESETIYELPKPPRACFDHLGRKRAVDGNRLELGRAPLYVLLPKNARPPLIAPPAPAKSLPGKPGQLVLQALLPDEDTVLDKSAHTFQRGGSKTISIFLYNFGDTTARGGMRVTVPEKWKAEFPSQTEIAPGERKELALHLSNADAGDWTEATIRVTGDFGDDGQPVLSFRLTASSLP